DRRTPGRWAAGACPRGIGSVAAGNDGSGAVHAMACADRVPGLDGARPGEGTNARGRVGRGMRSPRARGPAEAGASHVVVRRMGWARTAPYVACCRAAMRAKGSHTAVGGQEGRTRGCGPGRTKTPRTVSGKGWGRLAPLRAAP